MSNISRSHKVSFHARRTLSRSLNMSSSQTTSSLPPIDNFTDKGDPSWFESYKWFLFSSYFNVLLIFVPLSALSHHLDWDVSLRFSFSILAIVPLAKLLGDSTEQISANFEDLLSSLFNALFGNTVEIIVGIAALFRDELRIVQTFMLGSILSSILLVLGCSFLAAGFKRKERHFRATAAQTSRSLMTLACITLVIPAAYYSTQSGDTVGPLVISRCTAPVLLFIYCAYIVFQMKTHVELYIPEYPENGEAEEEEEKQKMNVFAAVFSLLAVTVLTAFCAVYLIDSIEEFAELYSVPKPFIGLILLPIAAAADGYVAVSMAMKNRMELTTAICVGSSIQIATFVVPVLVIIGWFSGHGLSLFFANLETIVLFVSVVLINTLIQDGKSNYMEGLMLVSLYFVIAVAFWVA